MPRIRTIKPEFPQSESIGRVSREARLCFILLWTLADDDGRLRGNSRMLASLLYPYDDDAPSLIDGWLDELIREKMIVRYKVDGQSYVAIYNWLKHQKIDHPSISKFPGPDEPSAILANPREPSPLDQGPRTKDSIKDQGDSEAPQASPPALKTKTIVKTKNEADPLYQAIFQSFISKTGAFTNYPKEAQGIKRIIKYCQQHAPKYTNNDPIKLAELVITKYFELTRNGDRFWRGQPFTPSNLSAPGIFDRVLIEIKPINEEVVENVIPF